MCPERVQVNGAVVVKHLDPHLHDKLVFAVHVVKHGAYAQKAMRESVKNHCLVGPMWFGKLGIH